MPDQPYKNPPITEAVIDVRFAAPVDRPDLEKASKKFASLYPHEQVMNNVSLAEVNLPLESGREPTARFIHQVFYKRLSQDASEILLLWPSNLVVSQLAPYPGWDKFFDRFVRDWEVWKKTAGYRGIARVAARYINRIDLPIKDGFVEHEKYLNIYPKVPDDFGPLMGYGTQVQFPLPDIGCTVVINSAAVPSPLLGYGSFLLDIDVGRDGNAPQSNSSIFDLLNQVRVKKNEIFEACLTDRARELFNER